MALPDGHIPANGVPHVHGGGPGGLLEVGAVLAGLLPGAHDGTGGVDDGAVAVPIKGVLYVLGGAPLGAVAGDQEEGVGQSFAQFGSDLDADTKARLAQGERVVEVLKQGRNQPIDVEKQVCILYAVTRDYLKEVAVEDVKEYEKGLYEYMDAHGTEVLSAIRTTGKLEEETEKALAAALDDYTRQFLNTRAK